MALATSKGMVGRRLLGCSLIPKCGEIVSGVIATWTQKRDAAIAVGFARLAPIKRLIDHIKTGMEDLFGELTDLFRQIIESILGAMGDVGRLVADVVKGAMQGLNENCGVEIPSCLIGPPEGCEDESSPVWESTIMTLSVSQFHSC